MGQTLPGVYFPSPGFAWFSGSRRVLVHRNHIDYEPTVGDTIEAHIHARGRDGKLYAFHGCKSKGVQQSYDEEAVHRALIGV